MSGGFSYASGGGHGSGGSGGGGVFGFVKNLAHDVGDAARGLPEGLIQTAEHPIRTAENAGKATWQTWSPLFHGDLGKFGHQFYDHPLAPMLDIATVFTGGASVAAKLGLKAADAGLISGDSALAKLGSMPTKVDITGAQAGRDGFNLTRTKYLPTNPIYNKASRALMDAADKSPLVPNWFSASKVYDRLEKASWAESGLALNAGISAAMKAGEVFNKAGHSDWANLEQQLIGTHYTRALNTANLVPLKDVLRNGGKAPAGYKFWREGVDASKPLYKDGFAKNIDQFANHMGPALGKKLTTGDVKQASTVLGRDGQVMVRLAHNRALEATYADTRNSVHFLAKLARYPTQVWKAITLGYSPRVVVNNGLGNWLMYSMRQSGSHAIRGFIDAVRYTKGEKAALQMLKETGKLPQSHYLNDFFAPEMGNTFGSSTLGSNLYKDMKDGKTVGGAGGGIGKIYQKSFYPLVHRYADVPVRAASISAYLRGDPTVKALMKQGYSMNDAARSALRASPELQTRAALHARTVAGNYATMSRTEQAVRDFVPFYLWDKHIAMHATNMLRDRPGRVAVGTAVGQQGANATRKQLGDIPEWMLGAVKLPFKVPGEGNRTTLLNTQGMNPYSSVPDLVGFAQGLTTGHTEDNPGDTILGTVNPVIKGLVEHTMGVKATGAPVTNHGGVIPSTLVDIFNSLRPVQLGRSVAGMTPPTTTKTGKPRTPKLYKTDINTILSALVGTPIQEADLTRAHALQKQIETGKKQSSPRKRSGNSYAS